MVRNKFKEISRIECFLVCFAASGNGVDENFGLRRGGAKQILVSFRYFLRLVVSKHRLAGASNGGF